MTKTVRVAHGDASNHAVRVRVFQTGADGSPVLVGESNFSDPTVVSDALVYGISTVAGSQFLVIDETPVGSFLTPIEAGHADPQPVSAGAEGNRITILAEPLPTRIAAIHPIVPALIQTPLSQQLLPGEWLTTNLQLDNWNPSAAPPWPAPGNRAAMADLYRIMLNVGCSASGVFRDAPAAFQGFEQADTPAEQERLKRFNSTSRVFDIKKNGDRWELDMGRHLIDVAGIQRLATHPVVHAVRAADWAALDEWVRWTADGRAGKSA